MYWLHKAQERWQGTSAHFMGKKYMAWRRVTGNSGGTGEFWGMHGVKLQARVKIKGLRLKNIK